MRNIPAPLTFSSIAIALTIGMGIGYFFTPQYSQMQSEKIMDLGVPDRTLDLRYLNAMISHHRAAILLAKQAQQSNREEIRSLALDIQAGEPTLIEELYGWKRQWYGDRRPVFDPTISRLGATDEKFDLRFLNALIAHHEAGVRMTKEIRLKSSRAEVLDNADSVEAFLTSSLDKLKSMRQQWYNVK